MSRSLGAAATAVLLVIPTPAGAHFVDHVVRQGDSVESLAARYYGNRALSTYILEANQLPLTPGSKLEPAAHLRIPTAVRYRLRRNETLKAVAARFLGDARRAPLLGLWGGLTPSDGGRHSTVVVLPFRLIHHARVAEPLSSLARMFYGDASQEKLLSAWNFRSDAVLRAGQKIEIPVFHVRVRSPFADLAMSLGERRDQKLADTSLARASAKEAALERRVLDRLKHAEAIYREGRYEEASTELAKVLKEEDPAEADLVAIHRLLGSTFVALEANDTAIREFREVRARAPDLRLDPVTTSPKILAVFEQAR